MKKETIKTNQMCDDKSDNTFHLKEWHLINFQWIPLVKLNNELNHKTAIMKNLFFLPLILLLSMTVSCTKDIIDGSGILISETRTTPTFSKINNDGVFEVNIIQGAEQSVEITTDNNVMPHVKTRVINNELRLYFDNENNYRNFKVMIDIVTTSLNGLKNSGTGDMYVKNVSEDGIFSIYNSGIGNINIEGIASSLDIVNEGVGFIYGFNFFVDNCSTSTIGSGDIEINCANKLDVVIEGSGDVYYKGSPIITTSIIGSGKIINSN